MEFELDVENSKRLKKNKVQQIEETLKKIERLEEILKIYKKIIKATDNYEFIKLEEVSDFESSV